MSLKQYSIVQPTWSLLAQIFGNGEAW